MSQRTSSGGRRVAPIESLNPYMGATWTIRARVANKGDLRTYSSARGDGKLFNVEFVDEHGTAIESTLWRETAEKYFDVLEEGKVYYVSKAGLKPANKTYSSVQNDYQLLISERTEIEECVDKSAEGMLDVKPRLNLTPIAKLPHHIGTRVLLDVMGVVTHAGPVGSVKRKSDASELTRRDLTLVDQSERSVTVTLWQDLAGKEGAELERRCGLGEKPLVAIQGVRTNDFNGVSVSTVNRSHVILDPEATMPEEARQLADWFATQPAGKEFVHSGQGLQGAKGAAGGKQAARVSLKELGDRPPPPVGSKPEYSTALAHVSMVPAEQALYYMAAPDGTNKKVVKEGEGFFCEGTQKRFDHHVKRYIMRCVVMDHTGSLTFNLFNDQAQQLLGLSADEISVFKEGGDAKYDLLLKNAQLKPYVWRIGARSEEYNGEVRVRYAVQNIRALDYAQQSSWLCSEIKALLGAAN